MSDMDNKTVTRAGKLNSEFWAIVGVGLVVLGQAAWLDAKIERVDVRLKSRIESLQLGQAAMGERLAALEAIWGNAANPAGRVEDNTNPKSAS